MIDFIKINHMPVTSEEVLANENLTFTHSNVTTEGEIIKRAQVALYRHMDVVLKEGNTKLKGSIHKYFEGGTNYKDFAISNIGVAVDELAIALHFDPAKAFINFIEIGVNIEVLKDPSELIKNFIMFRHKEFENLPVIGKGYGRKCETQRFTIKIYNKSQQYGLPYYLLRYEVKITRMEFLKTYGINNLSLDDLKNPALYAVFLEILLDIFERIVLSNPDFNPDNELSPEDRELALVGRYPEYWKDLPRQRKSEQIKKYVRITGTGDLKNELALAIKEKWESLMSPDNLTTLQPTETDKLTTLPTNQAVTNPDKLTTLQITSKDEKADKLTTLQNLYKKGSVAENGQFNPTINGYSRMCPVTHVDISMQKENSRFLSTAGLRLLKETDPDKYFEFRQLFLPRTGIAGLHTRYEQDEITHIAKQIRNEYHNRRRYFDRVPENQLSIFKL